jgi:hypothetical protein
VIKHDQGNDREWKAIQLCARSTKAGVIVGSKRNDTMAPLGLDMEITCGVILRGARPRGADGVQEPNRIATRL